MRTRLLVTALAAALVLPIASACGSPSARVLLVGSWHGKKGNFDSIQAAVDAARPGNWILIDEGPRAVPSRARPSVSALATRAARPG